jgi:hypothetical protein
MSDWKIRRRLGECTHCETAFEDGTRHASLLRIDAEEALVREDICDTCWDGGEGEDVLFWWFTVYYQTRKQTVQMDLASLERLFMELDGREEEKLRELRYLLCLLLMRKRKLKLQKVKRDKAGECLLLRRPRREEELAVWVYDFTPDRMEELRSSLQELMDGAGPRPEDLSGGDADSEDTAGETPTIVESDEEEAEIDEQIQGSEERDGTSEPAASDSSDEASSADSDQDSAEDSSPEAVEDSATEAATDPATDAVAEPATESAGKSA